MESPKSRTQRQNFEQRNQIWDAQLRAYSFERGSGGADEKQEVQPLFYSIKPAHADLR